ncbi:MAG: GNAT superfamily N-acetyltransferase [Flavobacteriales bacterium]|jgi:GNAT superfamily N-acetyltransferase
MTQLKYSIRKGEQGDVPDLLRLIKALAVYEKAADEVILTEEDLLRDGFGAQPKFQLLVAEMNQEIVGIAVYYDRYSTWKGRTLYLEDLIVEESKRRLGLGQELLKALIQIAEKEGVERLEWQVLDWNKPAIEFYKYLGATIETEWYNCKFIKGEYSLALKA